MPSPSVGDAVIGTWLDEINALVGGAGKDNLKGEAGNDALTGGSAQDFFSGGHGTDSNVDFVAAEDTTDGS